MMHYITLEVFTEIWLPHNGLLASKLGKKASTILGAIHFGFAYYCLPAPGNPPTFNGAQP